MPDDFDTFAHDDRINHARWLSGVAFEASTDRLKAFVEVLQLLEGHTGRGTIPADWATVKDRDGDLWDRQPEGRWALRNGFTKLTEADLLSVHGPVRPIVLTDAA